MPSEAENDLMADLMQAVRAEHELSKQLAEFVGEWVAVREHSVVAHAETLGDLLEEIDTSEVEGIFQVAEQGTASFF